MPDAKHHHDRRVMSFAIQPLEIRLWRRRSAPQAAALAVALVTLLCLLGCDPQPQACRQIDTRWHRQDLIPGNLAHWLAAAPADNGFFRSAFTRDWQAAPAAGVPLTAQARLIYAMVRGYDATGDQHYLDAAKRGGDFLLEHFRDPEHPGWYDEVGPDGKVRSAAKKTYSHAFSILALAHLYRVSRDERYREAALLTWGWLYLYLRDPAGGYPPEAKADFTAADGLRTQNPVMHLFEAVLALWEITRDPDALTGVRDIGDFIVGRLLVRRQRDAYIPEWYSPRWTPLPGDQGGYIDLGHQFEWAYLLSAANLRGLPDSYAQAGEAILTYALQEAYDQDQGGCFNRLSPEGLKDLAKGWWEQSETLRTLMHYATVRGHTELWPRYEQTLAMVKRDFADAVHGGWYPSPLKDCGKSPCTLPQAGFGYHIAAMHMEALDLTAQCKDP